MLMVMLQYMARRMDILIILMNWPLRMGCDDLLV